LSRTLQILSRSGGKGSQVDPASRAQSRKCRFRIFPACFRRTPSERASVQVEPIGVRICTKGFKPTSPVPRERPLPPPPSHFSRRLANARFSPTMHGLLPLGFRLEVYQDYISDTYGRSISQFFFPEPNTSVLGPAMFFDSYSLLTWFPNFASSPHPSPRYPAPYSFPPLHPGEGYFSHTLESF